MSHSPARRATRNRSVARPALVAIVLLVGTGGCGAATPGTPVPVQTPEVSPLPPTAAPSPTAASAGPHPAITIDPADGPVDQPRSIRLSGFAPGIEVTVRVTTIGTAFPDLAETGTTLESSATFLTDAQGEVDLDTQAPVSGSYAIPDGMGLIWSMTEKPAEAGASAPPAPAPPELVGAVEYRDGFTAEVGGEPVATASASMMMGSPAVTATEIAADGVLGQFYRPAGDGPFPGVILLSGSQGGLARRGPKVVAAHGYAVLSLAYFGYTSPVDGSSLPADTHELPLEYFGKAIEWLRSQPGVDPDRIGMIGYSLGGQAALLAATHYPQVKTVIALSAPTYTWDWGGTDSSFSFGGKPIPFAKATSIDGLDGGFTKAVAQGTDPLAGMPGVLAGITADPAIAAAIIPVEKINGSILFVSGTNDSQLPGPVYGELAMDRLKAHNFAFPYRHIIGRGAGHLVDFPYAPRQINVAEGGGTAEANARSAALMWPVVLDYLAAMK